MGILLERLALSLWAPASPIARTPHMALPAGGHPRRAALGLGAPGRPREAPQPHLVRVRVRVRVRVGVRVRVRP